MLTHLAFPEACRADSGVRAGDAISPFYDPMIAKVIVHGPTRDVALRRLDQALAGTQVAGTVTNLAFLGALARHDGFVAGDVDTGLIGRDIEALMARPKPKAAHAVAAGMAAAGLTETDPMTGFTLWQPLRRSVRLALDGEAIDLAVEVLGPKAQRWHVEGVEMRAENRGGRWWIDGSPAADVVLAGDIATVFDGYGIAYDVIDPLDVAGGVAGDGNLVEAPMPGLVKAVFAKAGAEVAEGDRLAVLEAMKMEHVLTAVRDGVVAEALAAEGEQVEAGAALVRLEDVA